MGLGFSKYHPEHGRSLWCRMILVSWFPENCVKPSFVVFVLNAIRNDTILHKYLDEVIFFKMLYDKILLFVGQICQLDVFDALVNFGIDLHSFLPTVNSLNLNLVTANNNGIQK